MSTPVWNPKTGKQFLLNDADVPAWTKAGYVLQMPSQETKPSAAPAQPAQQPQVPLTRAIRDQFEQGITKNSDELAGAGRAAMGAVADKYHELKTGHHTPLTMNQDYHAGRDDMRKRLAEDATAHPLTSAASNLAGGVTGGVAAMEGGVPGAAAYGASEGIGEAPELSGEAMKAGAIRGATDGAIAGLVPGARAASVIGKVGPRLWMGKLGLRAKDLGFKTEEAALKGLGSLFEKNPALLRSRSLKEFLEATEGARKAAGQGMDAAYAARGGAPVASRAQLYKEVEKHLAHLPAQRESFMNNVARSADRDAFTSGVEHMMNNYGYGPQDAETAATELLKADHTQLPAEKVQEWINGLGNAAKSTAADPAARASGQAKAADIAHTSSMKGFNQLLDPESRAARQAYMTTVKPNEAVAKVAANKVPGSILPKGGSLPSMIAHGASSGATAAMGQTQRALTNPSVQSAVGGAAIGGLPVAAQHFAGMAKSLGLLDIPDATDKAARDMLLSERHGDYSEARREAAKEHDQHQAELDQQAEKAK